MRPTATDPKVLKAYAHPLRAQAMELLEARVTSPSEIATALGQPVGVIAYHVRMLQDAGLVTLVERRQRRGAIEHFYTAPVGPTISDIEWSELPILERRAIIAGGLRRFGPEFGSASARGGLDKNGADLSRIRTSMDQDGWLAATRELKNTVERIERLAADAKLRLFDVEPSRTKYAVVMLMLFKEPGRRGQNDGTGSAQIPIDFSDPKMLAAEAHPLRSEIFKMLQKHEASPSDLARTLGAPVSNASYHVRQLATLGLVELIDRRESRGALEHYYRARVWPTILSDGWEDSLTDKAASSTAALILDAARHGGFDHDDIHLTRTPFPIDPQSWERAADILAVTRRRLERLAVDTPSPEPRTTPLEDVHAISMLFERTLALRAVPEG